MAVDCCAGVPPVRGLILASALAPAKEYEALLGIESQLEQGIRDVLAGGKPALETLLGRTPQPTGR